MNSKQIIDTLRARGWEDRAIGEAIERNRILVWRIRTGKTELADEETYRRLLGVLNREDVA